MLATHLSVDLEAESVPKRVVDQRHLGPCTYAAVYLVLKQSSQVVGHNHGVGQQPGLGRSLVGFFHQDPAWVTGPCRVTGNHSHDQLSSTPWGREHAGCVRSHKRQPEQ